MSSASLGSTHLMSWSRTLSGRRHILSTASSQKPRYHRHRATPSAGNEGRGVCPRETVLKHLLLQHNVSLRLNPNLKCALFSRMLYGAK